MTGISSQSELSCIKARENVTPWRKKKKKRKDFYQSERKTRRGFRGNIKSDLQSKIKRERAMNTRHVTVQLIFNSKSISTATCKASWEKKKYQNKIFGRVARSFFARGQDLNHLRLISMHSA